MILTIPIIIWQQMQFYVCAVSPREVTGIGLIEQISDRELRVKQIFLPEQYTNIAHCEFAPGALNDILTEVCEMDINNASKLRFRWHSHAEGEVFWSAIDEEDIANWDGDWVVNLVTNARQGILARLDLFRPQRFANLPLSVKIDYSLIDPQLVAKYYNELAAKVQQSRQSNHSPANLLARLSQASDLHPKGGEEHDL